jgi:hypothetical protein
VVVVVVVVVLEAALWGTTPGGEPQAPATPATALITWACAS